MFAQPAKTLVLTRFPNSSIPLHYRHPTAVTTIPPATSDCSHRNTIPHKHSLHPTSSNLHPDFSKCVPGFSGVMGWGGIRVPHLVPEQQRERTRSRASHIYQHLGQHPRILRCYGPEEVHPGINSLRLGDVRKWIREHKAAPLPYGIRLQMALILPSAQAISMQESSTVM